MSSRDGYEPDRYAGGGYSDRYGGGSYDSDATLPYAQRPRRPRAPRSQRPDRNGRTTRPLKRRRRWPVRLLKIFTVVVVLLAIVVGGLFLITPSVSQAPALVQEQAVQHGISYPGVQPPQKFTEALVATEDHRFYSTPGIDPLAVGRLIAGKLTGHPDQGGSTLEQQLAKNLYTMGRSGFTVEAEQVVLAVKLNMSYSKPQLLQMYAEIAYYGSNYYGLRDASCGYFGVEPAQLTWPEAAVLAGVVNAPTQDDPRSNPQNARAREVHVVGRLVAVGDLTQAQGAAVLAGNLSLVPVGTGCSS
jgi:membrane peptidoglycan carboxypeptidase